MITIKEFYDIWNELHCRFIKQGAKSRNSQCANWCEEQIILAKKAYYETGNPIMEDNVYDKIESYLTILRPCSKILEKVGS